MKVSGLFVMGCCFGDYTKINVSRHKSDEWVDVFNGVWVDMPNEVKLLTVEWFDIRDNGKYLEIGVL